MPEDRIQREIEDILNRLDTFLPEESVTTKVRRRSSGAAASFLHALIEPLAHVSLRQVMLTAIVLIIVGFFAGKAYPEFGRWTLIGGVILLLAGFATSFFSRERPQATERRWRGQPMVLAPPTLGDRLRAWLRAKRRRP
jgi:hypothetical protein